MQRVSIKKHELLHDVLHVSRKERLRNKQNKLPIERLI